MKNVRYLCIDDEKQLIAPLITNLRGQRPDLRIESLSPSPFETQLVAVEELHQKGSMDGLLLDLRLDQTAALGSKPVRYSAPGLAAQLRNWLATRKQEVSGFPILLWSIENKLAKAFKTDGVNQDLFDLVLHKEQLPKDAKQIAAQMVALVQGYRLIFKTLKCAKHFSDLLFPPTGFSLDARIGQQFGRALKSFPTHAFAQFILRELIFEPGPLLDERTVCARLGIDYQSKGREALMAKLASVSRYVGPFGDEWPRWWTLSLDEWCRKLTDGNKPFSRMLPEQRVEVIKAKTKISGLTVAVPKDKSYSSYFSTICQHTLQPLDPIDGFVIAESGRLPWQSKRYVSREVALDSPSHNFREKLEPAEVERLRSLRQNIKLDVKKGSSKIG